MKKNSTLTIIFLFFFFTKGFAQWEKIHWPLSDPINSISIFKNKIFLGNPWGLHFSPNKEAWWNPISSFPPYGIEHIASNDSLIYVERGDGISASQDGFNWKTLFSKYGGITWIYLFKSKIIYSNSYYLFISENFGTSWQVVNGSWPKNYPPEKLYHDKNILYGYRGNYLYTSEDGITWSIDSIKIPKYKESIKDFSCLAVHNGILFAGGNGTVFYSHDDGGSWATIPGTLSSSYIKNMYFNGLHLYVTEGNYGIWRTNIGALSTLGKIRLNGVICFDKNNNCQTVYKEKSFSNILIKAEPGPYYAVTDSLGNYKLGVDTGKYTVTVISPDVSKELVTISPSYYTVKIDGTKSDTSGFNFGINIKSCALLRINLNTNRLRRCFPSTADITYINRGTTEATNVKVKVTFPEYILPISSSIPWTAKEGNVLTYNIGILAAGAAGNITIKDSVLCGIEDIRGLTQCIKAEISPANTCDSVNPAWDKSSMKVTGVCDNSQVKMVIKNAGSGSMVSNSEYRVFLDNVLVKKTAFKLNSSDSLVLMIPSQGETVRLEADQHPKHPGNSRPRATIEACGSSLSAASKGFFLDAPLDNGNAGEQSTCLTIVDSYDPNDKSVIPSGGYIDSLQDLEYTIRFQNTGTDTAYNIVVIDTISGNLDIESFQNTGSSHGYKCGIEGRERIIKWSFSKINLPDSAANNPGSNGYISYKIKQKSGNKKGISITNKAFIYFDYNSAIITNETMNTVFDTVIADYSQGANITVNIVTSINEGNDRNIRIYPNPAQNKIIVESTADETRLIIVNIAGQRVLEQNLEQKTAEINIGEIPAGAYFIKIQNGKINKTMKLVITR